MVRNMELKPCMSVEELNDIFSLSLVYKDEERSQVYCSSTEFEIDNQLFKGTFAFQSGRLRNLCLLPIVVYPSHVVSESSRRAYRHQICDMWLNRLLGTPNWKTRDVTIYSYWWGRISSIAYKNDDLLNRGGSISIQYYDVKKE